MKEEWGQAAQWPAGDYGLPAAWEVAVAQESQPLQEGTVVDEELRC